MAQVEQPIQIPSSISTTVAEGFGFDDVRIVTWPIETLEASGLPLKPLDQILPYSDGIEVERPDALLPNLGGQSGLNLSSELARAGVLKKYGVKVIGVQIGHRLRHRDHRCPSICRR